MNKLMKLASVHSKSPQDAGASGDRWRALGVQPQDAGPKAQTSSRSTASHAWESSPMTLFYDGHIGQVSVFDAVTDDEQVRESGACGARTRHGMTTGI